MPASGNGHVNESSRLATQTVTTIAGLWKIEAIIRGQDPETRVKAHQEKSAANARRSSICGRKWEKVLPRLSGKFKLAEAIYTTSRRLALERFVSDGRIVAVEPGRPSRCCRPPR